MSTAPVMADSKALCSHTPGPWHLKRDANREEYSVIVPPKEPGAVGYLQIASLDFGFLEPFESQQHANARLIAAAPDLLRAAKQALACAQSLDTEMTLAYQALRAAIAKAEGRS